MTPAQFNAIARLIRMRDGPAQAAARLVLVGGLRKADAARSVGIPPAQVNNAVTRMARGLDLARLAA